MRHGTGVSRRPGCVILVLLVWATGTWSVQIRVVLYDIQVLSTGVIDHRESSLKLRQVMALLGTYAIGPQKLAVRAAIDGCFPHGVACGVGNLIMKREPCAQTSLHHPMRSRCTACDDRRIKAVTG